VGVVGLLKRYRELILVAFLLVVPLGVFFAHAKRPSERSRLDRVILGATAPIEKGIAWAVTGSLGLWRGYIALHGAHERAAEVTHRLNVLELDRLELERVRAENDRLRQLLAFPQAYRDLHVIGARVIGVRLDPKGLQLVTIDRGASDGVERMMPVVVAHGVVGRIHSVDASSADVLLLSDRNSSIAVRVERSRARANVRGTGSPDLTRLEYALRSDDMNEGDVLVTSGTDGVFPRGLPVGRIAGLKRTGQGLYQRADVAPIVDVTKLEEVLVITSSDRPPETAPQAVGTPAAAGATTATAAAVSAAAGKKP
jgi:rod shape-determining protein MreC